MNVKDIKLKVIPANIANEFVKKHHYSGKVVPNSNLHFGAFYKSVLHGVMSFGPSINKTGTINLVKGTSWNGFIELNRMAFDDTLPKNSESRCISVAMKLLKKNAPHIDWVISFADGTQCGDGTIYRACGFDLVGITENTAIRENPVTKEKMHVIQAHHKKMSKEFRQWKAVEGYQLKYVYFINKKVKKNLTKPIIPYSKISEMGISMYKGKKLCDVGVKSSTLSFQDKGRGAVPTTSLQIT